MGSECAKQHVNSRLNDPRDSHHGGSRPTITVSSVDPIFKPESGAVVGASASAGSVGGILMRNLMENPLSGAVYPVNPKRKAVHGVLCYPSLKDVPEAVDLVVIATPAVTVPNTVRECVARGAKGAIIISAGFSELGAEGGAMERQIRDIARGASGECRCDGSAQAATESPRCA